MKKITRKDFQGLRQYYPVLSKEEMRRYVGGYSNNYWNEDWLTSDLYLSDFGVSVCSSGGYGSYGGDWDIDGGYLDEVVIYGSQGGNPYSDGGYGYPGWGSDSDWGDDWGYGYGGYGDGNLDGGNKRGDIIDKPWACMFNCMNFIDPSKSADEYYKMYLEKSKGKDPSQTGGLYNKQRNKALKACGFSFEETKVINPSGGYQYIAIVNTAEKESHAVIITGKNADLVKVYDPSMPEDKRSYDVNINYIGTMYRIEK